MVAAVRSSFPHMGGIHANDDDAMFDEAGTIIALSSDFNSYLK